MNNTNKKKFRTPKGKRKINKVLLVVLIVLLVLAIAGMIGYAVVNHMMNTAPVVNTEAPWADETTLDGSLPAPVVREEGSYNFLVVGKDNIALNTDVMMIINLDLRDDRISIMQIPRDTFITFENVPRKINSIYSIFYNSSDASDTAGRINDGMQGLASVLSENLAINIDFYANMNLDAFGNIVDAIGGVEMDVPYRMFYEDPGQNLYIDLQPGLQTLDGDQAQQFVRFRKGYIEGDTGRQDAQKIFMSAFIKSFKENISLANLTPVVTNVLGNLTHSLQLSECLYFVKQAMGTDFSNMVMLSAPNTPHTYNGLSYVVLHRAAMYKVINENFNVFDTDIPEASFDKDKNFTLLTDSGVNAIYNSTQEFDEMHGVDDIQQDGLDINLVG